MRIVHLDSGLAMRGGQWQALRLAQGLASAGHSVTFLSPRGSPCFEEARKSGLAVQALSALSVRRTGRQADLIHAHDARSHTLAALVGGAPLIVSRRVGFPIQGGLSRWKYARARHFIAVSNYVKSVLIESGVAAEKISVVYDGVPLLTPAMSNGNIIAPASVDPQKGTALAVEAARLAGATAYLSSNLESDLPGSSVFVYLTRAEGLGSAILLAMSAGVPVVASRIGGIPEIVVDGETGLLAPNDAAQIAAAILRLRQDPAFSTRLAERARQNVEERFSIKAMIDGTMRTYNRVLSC